MWQRMGRRCRPPILLILALLLGQFALGMVANLDVAFPSPLPPSESLPWAFAHSLVVPLHILLGVLLLLASLATSELAGAYALNATFEQGLRTAG